MAVQSMTGFGRADGALGALSWVWEARSVNGRGLDVRLRLAQGFDMLETPARELCTRKFQRGTIQLTLTAKRTGGTTQIRLNEAVLAQVAEAARRAANLVETAAPRLDGLLAIKGVLEAVENEETEETRSRELSQTLVSLEQALDHLAQARGAEGRRMTGVLREQLDRVESLVQSATLSPARTREAIAKRLSEHVSRLIADTSQLDPVRLHQEAALLAAKADIEEELKRLSSHVMAGRDLLDKGGSIGRQFDFLAQEFNREANTLCAKSNDADITRIGLALKLVVDQMREQVQNVE